MEINSLASSTPLLCQCMSLWLPTEALRDGDRGGPHPLLLVFSWPIVPHFAARGMWLTMYFWTKDERASPPVTSD